MSKRWWTLTAAVTTAAALTISPAATAVAAPEPAAAVTRDSDLPPNQRQPKVPNPPKMGDAPWTTEAARDVQGYRLSTYTGKYYDKRFEQYRLCVVQRESGGYYTESSSGFIGAYQFSYSLSGQALSAMRAEIGDLYGNAGLSALARLDGQPMYKWNRFWQDAAFWTIFDGGRGWSHWSSQWGASWHCDHTPNAESGWPNPNRYHYAPLERSKSKRATTTSARNFGTPAHSKAVARTYIRNNFGWGQDQFRALKDMWWRESNWRYDVVNPHPNGPWYGLGQVTASYISSRGYTVKKYMASPRVQVKVGAAYIKERYGSPTKAWSFWQSNNWY